MKKTLVFGIVVALMFVFGGFCVSAEENVLVIGDFQPLSGPGASLGVGNHRGVELAVDDINAQGGITVGGKQYTLKTIVYDHKGTAEGGVTAANKLVFDDGVKFIVGTTGSGPSIAATEAFSTSTVHVMLSELSSTSVT